jgi:hypothetical protein
LATYLRRRFSKTEYKIGLAAYLRSSFSKTGISNHIGCPLETPFFKKRDLKSGWPPIRDAVFQKTGSQISVAAVLRRRFSKKWEGWPLI